MVKFNRTNDPPTQSVGFFMPGGCSQAPPPGKPATARAGGGMHSKDSFLSLRRGHAPAPRPADLYEVKHG
jgi:hypothetical protein